MSLGVQLSRYELTKLFAPSKNNAKYIHGREGKTIEYKENYNHGSMSQYFKTIASFANTEGGYIIFGIGDSPREFLGLHEKSKKQFDSLKTEKFTNSLNEYFQPEIKWAHTLFEYKSKYYGIIYTFPLENKPCICSKTYQDKSDKYSLKEGDIYYRYRARSQKIRFAELQGIFRENSEKEAKKWRNLIEQTAKFGVSNSTLLNLGTGEIKFDKSTIVIEDKLLDKIKFVKEGHFVENEGAPTLKLLGEIKNIQSYSGILVETPKLRAIEIYDVIKAFLCNESIESPFEYVKVILSSTSGFQPIYHFLHRAEITPSQMIKHIEERGRSNQTVNLIKERLSGRKEKQMFIGTDTDASKQKRELLLLWKGKDIESISVDKLETNMMSLRLLQSFMLIDDDELIQNEEYYRETLWKLYDRYYKKVSGNLLSNFRKAICRLDEVFFDKKKK